MRKNNERDLERSYEEHASRVFNGIFNSPNEQERKKAERELAEDIARPGLTDNLAELARGFEIRLKRSATLPPGVTAEYREAFEPFLQRVAAIPPFDKWEVLTWDLWTQHMVQFFFAYGVEPLRALLCLKAFALIAPSDEYFEAVTGDPYDIERARRTREFVEKVESDFNKIVDKATGRFVEALRGRLGDVVDATVKEIVVSAINELEEELSTTGENHVARLRNDILKQWTKVEKVRIGTAAHGGNRSNTDLSRLKEHFDAQIDAVKEAFADCSRALSSRSKVLPIV
jgi:hypothetical protein